MSVLVMVFLSNYAQSQDKNKNTKYAANREMMSQEGVTDSFTIYNVKGSGLFSYEERFYETNEVSIIEKLQGCFTISNKTANKKKSKIIYLQFLDPDMQVIKDDVFKHKEDMTRYSTKIETFFFDLEGSLCGDIAISRGSLAPGIYTLNIFDNQRLVSSVEFPLK